MKAAAREAIEQLNDEITSKWVEAEKRWAEMDAEIAHKDEFIRHLAVKNAIDNALVSCGVKSTFFRAAEAVLFDHLDIEVQEDSDGQVMVSALGPYGRTTIASAVASWLDSDEGVAFRPKLATHEVGPFASAVRRLRSKLH